MQHDCTDRAMNEQDELFMREALPRAGRDGQLLE
jgi:hypothetical protein